MNFRSLFLSVVSGSILVTSGLAAPGPAVQYNPPISQISGNQPFAPTPNSTTNPFTLSVQSPALAQTAFPITVNLTTSVPNPVGGVGLPIGALLSDALSYVSISPSTITFTGPGQQIPVKVSMTVPLTAVLGSYGYLIKGNWPAGVTDGGATINMTVLPQIVVVKNPPTITNLLPANGTNFTYDPATTGPVVFPISYDANVVATGPIITSMYTEIDGIAFNGTNPYPNTSSPLAAPTVTGLFARSAHSAVSSPGLIDGGPHTIIVKAGNDDGEATATTVINVRTPPVFTSANAATFTVGQAGSFTVTATGFPAPTLSLTSGTLPAGLTFNASTGVISGTPTTNAGSPITLTFSAANVVRTVTQTFTLTVIGAPQLSWATPAAITYGTALSGTQLNATAAIGTANVPGTAVYSPAAGTVLPVGTQTLNVVFTPADPTYAPLSGSVSIIVNKKPLTVTAADASRVYGAANPSFSATLSGFVNGDGASVVTGSAAVSSGATNTSSVGTYSITPAIGTLAAANYSFTFVNGTLTVTKAPLTVTAANASRVYGVANPTFTATLSGFVNGNTASSSVTGSAALSTLATTTTAPGSYPITAAIGSLASTNYSFTTFVPGTLTITKANQTIAFGALATKDTGSGSFALTATASSGLAVTYTSSNLSVATVSGSTVTVLAAGTTTITASQPGDANYNAATPVAQVLTVQAPQTCPTTIIWLPPISLDKVQQDGSVIPIKFLLQQCCQSNCNGHSDDDDEDHHAWDDENDDDGHRDYNDDGWNDSHYSGHGDDYSGGNVTCHHGSNGRSTSNSSCQADCDHGTEDDKGCVNLRDKTVVISIYEVGSSVPATQYVYGTGSPNPPDYIIDGDYKYQLNFPTAKGSHRYHIDVYRFPPGATSPVRVGTKEFSVK